MLNQEVVAYNLTECGHFQVKEAMEGVGKEIQTQVKEYF